MLFERSCAIIIKMQKSKSWFKVLELEEQHVRDTYLRAIEKVYKHGRFILGPEVDELEENCVKFATESMP